MLSCLQTEYERHGFLTFSTTDDESEFCTDRDTDNFMVMACEDSSGCRIVTYKEKAAGCHWKPVQT